MDQVSESVNEDQVVDPLVNENRLLKERVMQLTQALEQSIKRGTEFANQNKDLAKENKELKNKLNSVADFSKFEALKQ